MSTQVVKPSVAWAAPGEIEATPLLTDDGSPTTPEDDRRRTVDDADGCRSRKPSTARGITSFCPDISRTTWFCIGLTLMFEISTAILTVPLITLYESVICGNYYSHGVHHIDLDGDPCKIPPIQSELALLRGWQAFFNGLSALVVALPLGYFADHTSHRKVMAIILVGMLAALLWTILVCTIRVIDVRFVWMTSLFYLCGGGNYAAEMILGNMIVNACSEADRTRNLYYYYSAFIFTELVGPPFSRLTANVSIWLPFGLGVACLCSCFLILAAMPDNKHSCHGESEGDDVPEEWAHRDADAERARTSGPWKSISRRFSSLGLLFRGRNMGLAVPMFLVGTFRNVSIRALLQYTSVRLGWVLSTTNFLITEVAVVNLTLFFFVLPSILALVNKRFRPSPQALNLGVVRASFVILVLGSAAVAFSATSAELVSALLFYACGFGARATLLSLVTSWVDIRMRSRLYSAILLVELTGMLAGEPTLQAILSYSFGMPPLWMGLPFLFCSACYLIALTASLLIRLDDTASETPGTSTTGRA